METIEQADAAIRELNHQDLNGYPLRVEKVDDLLPFMVGFSFLTHILSLSLSLSLALSRHRPSALVHEILHLVDTLATTVLELASVHDPIIVVPVIDTAIDT
jgi:RNA recognition motif-containing protein